MAGLCVLSIFTVWKMSTTPSYLIRSSTILRVMKTPVLPTPALQGEEREEDRLDGGEENQKRAGRREERRTRGGKEGGRRGEPEEGRKERGEPERSDRKGEGRR